MMNRVFLPLVMLLSLAATLVGAGDSTLPPTSVAGPWVRGDFGTLSVAADGSSYTFSYGTTTFKSCKLRRWLRRPHAVVLRSACLRG
jgi:hypothetical protein